MKIVNNIDELMEYLGIKKGDKVEFITPQFHREYDLEIDYVPQDQEELELVIKTTPKDVLLKMGVRVWDELSDGFHYLFPREWYDSIPEGFEILFIDGTKGKFKHGETDDDVRFGCLAYGFSRKF